MKPLIEVALLDLKTAAQLANISEEDAIAGCSTLTDLICRTQSVQRAGRATPISMDQILELSFRPETIKRLQQLEETAAEMARRWVSAMNQFNDAIERCTGLLTAEGSNQCRTCSSYVGCVFAGDEGMNYLHCAIHPFQKPETDCPDFSRREMPDFGFETETDEI